MLRTLGTLLLKELRIELRQKSVISGIGLYLVSLIFICYLTFTLGSGLASSSMWSALFWLTILFSVVNSVGKSFIGEKKGLSLYYYYVASPLNVIVARIVYNSMLSLLIAATAYVLFAIFLGTPVQNSSVFFLTLLLSSVGLSAVLSLISAIASKTSHGNIVMAVLSFPAVIGILLLAVRATRNAIDGLDPSVSYEELLNLFAVDCLLCSLACVLFPYVWKS